MVDNADLVKYTVSPDPLETHGGKVALTVDVDYPEKYFHKKAVLTATPYLQYEGGKTDLKSETLQGEAVAENYKVISFTTGGSLNYSDEVDYIPEMMRSELWVGGKATVGSQSVDLPAKKIADGIVATPLLLDKSGRAIMFNDNFKRIIPDAYQADIHYVINKYEVRSSELKQDDIVGMKDFIKKANSNDRIELKGIDVSAYASPDGPLDLNTELSGNREGSATKLLKNELKTSKIEIPADVEFFKLMSTPEDWEGFKKLMEESNIKDKDLILRVLSMYSDPVVREKEIKNIAAAFEQIKIDILPQLRRSKMTVKAEKIGFSDEELKQMANSDLDSLNLEELLYTATLFEDLGMKRGIYEQAANKYPGCLRAHNNVGYVKVLTGDAKGAEANFKKAQELRDINIITNNLGVVALAAGDLEKAKELFTAAMGAGDEVNYNMGILSLLEGNYESAASYYGSTASLNSALTKMLQGNNSACYNMLRDLPGESAKGFYLMAVAMAREGDTERMYNALASCVARDAKWKAYAKKDVEFFKYWAEQTFLDTVK